MPKSLFDCACVPRPPFQTLGGRSRRALPPHRFMIAGQCFTLRKLDTSSPTERAGLLRLNRVFEPPTGLSLSAPLAAVFYISLGRSAVIFSLAPGSLFKWRVFPCLSPQHSCGSRYGKEQIWSLLFSFFLSLSHNKEKNVVTFSH